MKVSFPNILYLWDYFFSGSLWTLSDKSISTFSVSSSFMKDLKGLDVSKGVSHTQHKFSKFDNEIFIFIDVTIITIYI